MEYEASIYVIGIQSLGADLMAHKLEITLSDEVYQGLRQHVESSQISRFIEDLLRPLLLSEHDLEAAYRDMAADTEREHEALEWIEAAPDEGLE
jgi:hypothetical protein